MNGDASVPSEPKGLVERLLSPIAEVRRGEGGGVVLMAMTMFLLMAAYYMLKTAREALILTRGGAEVKTYASAGQALILLIAVPAFAALASHMPRMRLMHLVTWFFAANVALFLLFGQTSARVGIIYFIWVGIFNVMVIAQYWGFAADLYTPEQGKRLFPVIGLGSSIGAWLGAVEAGRIIGKFGPFSLMAAGGGLLLMCLMLVTVVHQWEVQHPDPARAKRAEEPLGEEGAFELIRKDRYLILITLYVVIFNIIDTSGDYLFGRLLVDQSIVRFGDSVASAPERERFVGAVYGQFYSYANLVGFLFQAFLVSRVFKWIGIGRALLVHPAIVLAGYVLVLLVPAIRPVGLFKVLDKSTDYSLGNTVKQALWLPTNRAAKYKAKQAVDSFFVRLGDVLQAGIVYGGSLLSFGVPAFAILNLVLGLGWLGIARKLSPLYEERARRVATTVALVLFCYAGVSSAQTTAAPQHDVNALAKATQNPVGDLISVPLQINFNTGGDLEDRTYLNVNLQPVFPFRLSSDVNVVGRAIVPMNSVPGPDTTRYSGVGDIQMQWFFTPAKPGKVIWGVGPVFSFPTATVTGVETGTWAMGPGVVLVKMAGAFVLGGLVTQFWPMTDNGGDPKTNLLVVQPFVNYNFGHGWALAYSPVITANWDASDGNEWTVPLGVGLTRTTVFNRRPMNFSIQYYANVTHPDGSAGQTLRFAVAWLFPK